MSEDVLDPGLEFRDLSWFRHSALELEAISFWISALSSWSTSAGIWLSGGLTKSMKLRGLWFYSAGAFCGTKIRGSYLTICTATW